MKNVVKIGSGAGFSDDRTPPAVELAENGDIDYLVFECLAERSIAVAQLDKLENSEGGYNEFLEERIEAVLPACKRRGIKILTNMGAANPKAAARKIADIAHRLGIKGLKIAVVSGDDVTELVQRHDYRLLEHDAPVSSVTHSVISANVYLGSEPLVEALNNGADIVVTGRVADPSLYLAPMIAEFGWSNTDWDLMAKGIHAGHLLECTAHVTGGYFIDPGFKDIPNPIEIGFPIAEMEPDGTFFVTKVPGSGGRVTRETCIEQSLYEIHDPANYFTADCVADFTQAKFEEVGYDRIKVTGAKGKPKTDTYKASVGYHDGYMVEAGISYCGTNAIARGQLALDMIEGRLSNSDIKTEETRFELIGINSILRGDSVSHAPEPMDTRIRVAARSPTYKDAWRIGHEVVALWLNGPAGGGGATREVNKIVAILSTLVPRDKVTTSVEYLEA